MIARLAFVSLLVACNSSDGSGPQSQTDAMMQPDTPGACANLAGTWAISGACGADGCAITQVGCALTQVQCTSGAHSTSGSVMGNQFSYTGQSGGGAASTCSGTANGNTISGTCSTALGPCAFSGSR